MRDSLQLHLSTEHYMCRACGYMQLAQVRSYGYAAGIENARRDAQRAVPMLLALARCPRCGQNDARIARHNRNTRIATSAIVGVIFAAIAALFLIAEDSLWIPLVFVPIGGATMYWLAHVMRARYPSEITNQVRFCDLRQPVWTPVPEPEAVGWKWL